MARIDQMPDYRAKLPKSVHNLSHRFGFTATVAHLMPVFHDFLNAGETVELGLNYNLRTQPLQSAAMVNITGHVEYFFVPMFLLYEPFGSMYYNVSDNYSSFVPTTGVLKDFPVLDFEQFHTEMQSHDTDLVEFEDWCNHAYRLFDLLAYNNTNMNSSNPHWNPNVFPYALLAYQCIYQYYYRLDTRETFDQHVFNWDKYYNTSLVALSDSDYKKLIRLHYRPYDSDYFTDIKISPIVDVLNLNTKTSFDMANQWLTRNYVGQSTNSILSSGSFGNTISYNSGSPLTAANSNPSSYVQTNVGFKQLAPSSGFTPTINGTDINTANIRAIFASEKLLSVTGRARKHYDDQTLAHFGVKVPHDVKHEISCFGHDRSQIHIGEVISTADTSNAALGEIAGKGYGSLNTKPHKFTAPCHGVVMAILSFVPEVCYGGPLYAKFNVMTNRADLYTPEYDHLGMQPLFSYEMSALSGSGIIGWQYRYEQWKRRYNRVTKAFSGTGNLDSWMLDFKPYHGNSFPNAANLSYTYQYFLHQPNELDQLMLVNYVTTLPASDETKTYDGDPFVVDAFVHCKKISTMSDYSLPRLDA